MNKIILMGRLTNEPEIRYTSKTNTLVATFRLAVNRRLKKDETDFINIVAWGKTGEFISKYFKKGQQVGIIGRIQTRNWEDEHNIKHYVTEVVAEEVYFADSKKDNSNNNTDDNSFIPNFNVIDDEDYLIKYRGIIK